MKKILAWIKLYLWDKPTKVVREPPPRVKALEIAHAYMVVTYHGQRINMLKVEYQAWKALGRKDKRAMALRMKVAEQKGHIRFEEIDGQLICIKNKLYESKKNAE